MARSRLIRYMVDAGAVDGTTGENKYYVDNFTLEQNAAVLRRLRWLLAALPREGDSNVWKLARGRR